MQLTVDKLTEAAQDILGGTTADDLGAPKGETEMEKRWVALTGQPLEESLAEIESTTLGVILPSPLVAAILGVGAQLERDDAREYPREAVAA